VIRFRDPRGIDFPYLLSMLHDSFMSRPNTIVVPGGKMELAMQLIFTPFVWRLMERRRKALGLEAGVPAEARAKALERG
ncbi:MAG TPA: phosphoribulokinase, partial [Myxococcota bacterium]|nr:phosphoribulokinase [Myxococcota bacterium]